MLPVDFLLMVNSIRGRILLIVCEIFLRKEDENRHFKRYSDATTAGPFIRSRPSKVIAFGTDRKLVNTFLLLVINNNCSPILHRFEDMAGAENRQFCLPNRHLTPPLRGTPQNFGMKLAVIKEEGWDYFTVKIA